MDYEPIVQVKFDITVLQKKLEVLRARAEAIPVMELVKSFTQLRSPQDTDIYFIARFKE